MFKLFFSLILLTAISFSQDFVFRTKLGNFQDASDFAYSPIGYFYICDTGANEIIKVDTNGVVHKTIGGYGWESSSFDSPTSVFLSGLNVYVSDYRNHSVKIFDKDLNFISSISKSESREKEGTFGYPLSAITNSLGDLFILDSENRQVHKYDIFGKYSLSFGGFDSGEFALSNPSKMTTTTNGKIIVLDVRNIFLFDEFGNGQSKLRTNERLVDIKFSNGILLFVFKSKVNLNNIESPPINIKDFDFNSDFKSALLINNTLYILLHNGILVFSKMED